MPIEHWDVEVRFLSRRNFPAPIRFDEAIPVAILGLAVNVVSAWLLSTGHDHHGHDHGNEPQPGEGPAAPGGGLVEFATRRRVTIAMCTVTLLLFGLIALGNLKVNLLPDLSYPTLTVRTEYTGAAPMEIETLISEPVEEAVRGD